MADDIMKGDEYDPPEHEDGGGKPRKQKDKPPLIDRRIDLDTLEGVQDAVTETFDAVRERRMSSSDAANLSKLLTVAVGAVALKHRMAPPVPAKPVGSGVSTPFGVARRGEPVRLLPAPAVDPDDLEIIRIPEPVTVRPGTPPPAWKPPR